MPHGMPWLKLWEEDLKRDCSILSLGSRGAWVWIFMYLRHHAGTSTLTLEEWSRVASAKRGELARALRELISLGVADILPAEISGLPNQSVTITCRRIVKEERLRIGALRRAQKYRDNFRKNGRTPGMRLLRPSQQSNSEITGEKQKQKQEAEDPPHTPPAGGDSPESLSAQPPTGPEKLADASLPTGLFARLYAAYPRHDGSRQKAWTAFRRLRPAPDESILGLMLPWLERAKRSDQWQDPNHIPHLVTWINQHRWENDPPPRTNGLKPDPGSQNSPSLGSRLSAADREALIARERERMLEADRERAALIRGQPAGLRTRQDAAWLRAYEAKYAP